eukprot:CFRG4216T1
MNESDNIRRQRRIFERSKQYAAVAIELDEQRRPCESFPRYGAALKELQQGLEIEYETSEERERARPVHAQMIKLFKLLEERMGELLSTNKGTKVNMHSSINPFPVPPLSPRLLPTKDVRPAASSSTRATYVSGATRLKNRTPRKGSITGIKTANGNRIRHTINVKSTLGDSENNRMEGHVNIRDSKVLKNIDPKIADVILNEIVDDTDVGWDSVVGLETAKQMLKEIVILPTLRPDLFTGLRAPARGVLLYGPPGNGKTMLAKAVAHEAKAKFFNISASSLVSKWMGESEKLVRTLFAMATELAPSVIFIDEIDSLLSVRSSNEHEASRRLKTEILVCFDGVGSAQTQQVLVMGATNRPFDLDEAGLRRLPKRVYIPLPDHGTRLALLQRLLCDNSDLQRKQLYNISLALDGYSCSDIAQLARDAALGPIRDLNTDVLSVDINDVRPITMRDFENSMKRIRPSVSKHSLGAFEKWSRDHGMT